MKIKGDVFKKKKKAPKEKKEKSEKRAPKQVSSASSDTLNETLSLFRDGMGIEEIADERDVSGVTIEGHMVKLFESGRLSKEDLLTLANTEHVEKVREVLLADFRDGVEKLRPVKDRLEELGWKKVSYFEIKVGVCLTSRLSSI